MAEYNFCGGEKYRLNIQAINYVVAETVEEIDNVEKSDEHVDEDVCSSILGNVRSFKQTILKNQTSQGI